MKKKFLTVALTASMVLGSVFSSFAANVDVSTKYDGGQKIDGTTGWNTADGDNYLISETPVTVKFTNDPFTDAKPISDNNPASDSNWDNFVLETIASDSVKGITFRADAFGWTYGEGASTPTYTVEKSWDNDWDLFRKVCNENKNVSVTATKTDAKTVTFVIAFGTAATETYTVTYPDGVPSDLRFHVGADGASIVVNEVVYATKDNNEEESTTKLSPNGSTKPETGNKPGEEATTKLSPEGSTKPETGDKPGEEATIKPSPEGTKDPEVVKATVVTADAAKAISDAAKVTSKDGKVLDVKLTATPVEDTTVAAGLVNADTALKAAKVKAFAVLDLKLTVDGKNVTLLDEKINVNIPMDKLFADIKADAVVAVYRIDKVNDKEQLSFLGTSKVAADKTITFATEHFSQYVFAVVENAEALKDVKVVEYVKDIDTKATPDMKVADIKVLADASVKPDTNKTGDTTPIMPLVVLAVVALGGVIVAVASKKRA